MDSGRIGMRQRVAYKEIGAVECCDAADSVLEELMVRQLYGSV